MPILAQINTLILIKTFDQREQLAYNLTMRKWNLKSGDPLVLCLAADARFAKIDYCNDHIWEISIGGGEPSVLAIQTTYGLRARAMRLFPRFVDGKNIAQNPKTFHKQPIIAKISTNYASILFSPFPKIDVELEYIVPDSHGVSGRIKITNQDKQERNIIVEWIGQLIPTKGQPMLPIYIQAAPVLSGKTENLAPIVFLTGGPQPGSGSFPTLSLPITISKQKSEVVTWTHAALGDTEKSFKQARQYATRNWEAIRAQEELKDAGRIEIYTGDPDWDVAFALSQKQALNLLISPTDKLQNTSFVINRLPDQGYSLAGNGTDYNYLWNGQTPIEAYYLAGLLLPSEAEIVKGFLRNFITTQKENGFIDWKPGLGGQKTGLLATPILSSLAWKIYEHTEDKLFLEEVYPQLSKFLHHWLLPEQDQDQDGIPEWNHPMQLGFDTHPLYSSLDDLGMGVDIRTSESPALCAFLYQESEMLSRMARVLGYSNQIPHLENIADKIKNSIEDFWDSKEKIYSDRDRDSHNKETITLISRFEGEMGMTINQSFDQPVRIFIRLQTKDNTPYSPDIFIYGLSASGKGRVEHVEGNEFTWHLGRGYFTSKQIYSKIDRLDVQNFKKGDVIEIYRIGYNYQHQSGLLPLWASMINSSQAKILVEKTLINPNKFWLPFGLPSCANPFSEETSTCQSVNLPWNELIGEGLINYGYIDFATELIMKIMPAIIQNLKSEKAFRRSYDAKTGKGIGEKNALHGLAPLHLFLKTLGVRLISPDRIIVNGFNPFPWPVTIKYLGLTILKQMEKSVVIFPDGQSITVDDPQPQLISLEYVEDHS